MVTVEVVENESLSTDEKTALAKCCNTVKKGQESFLKIAEAIQQINDDRLYRETHKSVKAFCVARFDMSMHEADRYVGAARVISDLKEGGFETLPKNEGQTRPLVPLASGKERRDVWQKVVDSGEKITAKLVQSIVDGGMPKAGSGESPLVKKADKVADVMMQLRNQVDKKRGRISPEDVKHLQEFVNNLAKLALEVEKLLEPEAENEAA